jgi:hypothetical protein
MEMMEVVSSTTPTIVFGEMLMHTEPRVGGAGSGINVDGIPLDPEGAAWIKCTNLFARNLAMMYRSAGCFQLGLVSAQLSSSNLLWHGEA